MRRPTPSLLEARLAIGLTPIKALNALAEYQAAFPELVLHAGVPLRSSRTIAADTISVTDPFHMQLGLPNAPAGSAPGGNGGIFVWWNGTHIQADCNGLAELHSVLAQSDPGERALIAMWPLIVLAKLSDLPTGANQPNPNDPEAVNPQGADLTKPIVIIQGITIGGDSLYYFAGSFSSCTGPIARRPAIRRRTRSPRWYPPRTQRRTSKTT